MVVEFAAKMISDSNGSTRWPVMQSSFNLPPHRFELSVAFQWTLVSGCLKLENSCCPKNFVESTLLASSASAVFGNFKIIPITSPVYTSFLFRVQQAMGNFFNKMTHYLAVVWASTATQLMAKALLPHLLL
ncbi:Cadherin EGF LAG seven-pass G-type receptor [Trichinella spiralis]|uniref:Cadherin EGF LAG seven-pass G-type receptor n=1 Tax=Trichinella spiralis TaxID=6334 RepID=A0ABR3K8N6_TRISP